MRLDAGVALITGGRGLLGAATAQTLAACGATVVVADRDVPARTQGGDLHEVPLDVCDEGSVAAAVSAASELGPLRVLVNCAGAGMVRRTLSRDGSRHDMASFRAMVELNLIGAFCIMTHAAEAMASTEPLEDGERGVIVHVSSLAGLEASAGQIAYGAAKAGVAGLVLPGARDLAPVGIRVVGIAPGGMADPSTVDVEDPVAAALLGAIPHPKRFGTPADFALLVRQLVEHPYLNGSVVRLDGGARLGLKA